MELKISGAKKGSPIVYVDESDHKWLKKYKWNFAKTGIKTYIVRTFIDENGKVNTVYIHRQIMGLNKGEKLQVDHKDRNTFNNCRSNLRIATQSQNLRNSRKNKNKTGLHGVHEDKNTHKFISQIQSDDGKVHLGCYDTPELAGMARDIATHFFHGEFGVYNYPESYIDNLLERVISKAERYNDQERNNEKSN
jgi:hypothetical protein